MNYNNYIKNNFRYMDPSTNNIIYYSGSLINRNIKRYLEKKKLKIVNKMVHIMLEDQINEAKQNRINKIKEKEILSKKNKLNIGKVVYTNMGEGIIQEIRNDNIVVLLMNITLHHNSLGYFHISDIMLENNLKLENNIKNTSILSSITNKLYNVKNYILGF